MDEFVPFGSRSYAQYFLLLLFARGMDILSTWIATPNLVLEGNPLARRLGWRWGIPVNVAAVFGLAASPLSAIAVSTTSLLVAARNFQSAWLMHLLGEEGYRDWHVARVQETRITLYLFCLAGNTLLTAGVGGALILFGEQRLVPFSIGLGLVFYAVAVAFFTLLALWRNRRAARRATALREASAFMPWNGAAHRLEAADIRAGATLEKPGGGNGRGAPARALGFRAEMDGADQ
jgi:hypothetical protein